MIDILIPTLNRSHVLADLIANIEDTTPLPHTTIMVLDTADTASWDAIADLPVDAITYDGTYPVKINAAYRATNSAYVLPTADDVKFYPDWLENALPHFDDPSIHVVGTDDLSPVTADRTHATMPILRRTYLESPGSSYDLHNAIFYDGYKHNYVETEVCQLAQHRNCWSFATDSVIEHLHPAWGKRPIDSTDQTGNLQGWDHDKELFEQRQAEWNA